MTKDFSIKKKIWKCPVCKRVSTYDIPLVLKICTCCLIGMEVVQEDG